jgi:AcrR family transcriptional regulator
MSPPVLRAAILRIAGPLFAAHGPDGVSMRRIAQACGVHLPSIYHAFENKQTLYEACCEAAQHRGSQAIAAAMEAAGAHEGDRLDAFARAVCAAFEADLELRAFLLQDEWRQVAWIAGSTPLAALFDNVVPIAARVLRLPSAETRHALRVFAVMSLARGMAANGGMSLPEPAALWAMAFASNRAD